jgi:ribosomal protein L22
MSEEPDKTTDDEVEPTPVESADSTEIEASAADEATRADSSEAAAPSDAADVTAASDAEEAETKGEAGEEPGAVETPEAESTKDIGGDELQAAVDEVTETPAAEEAPKPARRRRRRGAEAEEAAAAPEKPKTTAPSRRRAQRDPSLPAPVVRAQAKYVRSSARKARLVCDHIRGKSVGEARAILALTPRAIARDWSKLLESAVANAEHNHELVGEDLYVKAVHADEGPTIKRFRPRAQGRATRILKRTSHLTILLTPKD